MEKLKSCFKPQWRNMLLSQLHLSPQFPNMYWVLLWSWPAVENRFLSRLLWNILLPSNYHMIFQKQSNVSVEPSDTLSLYFRHQQHFFFWRLLFIRMLFIEENLLSISGQWPQRRCHSLRVCWQQFKGALHHFVRTGSDWTLSETNEANISSRTNILPLKCSKKKKSTRILVTLK